MTGSVFDGHEVRTEELMREAGARLEEIEVALALSREAAVALDSGDRIKWCNRAFLELAAREGPLEGWRLRDISPSLFTFLRTIPPTEHPTTAILDTCMAGVNRELEISGMVSKPGDPASPIVLVLRRRDAKRALIRVEPSVAATSQESGPLDPALLLRNFADELQDFQGSGRVALDIHYPLPMIEGDYDQFCTAFWDVAMALGGDFPGAITLGVRRDRRDLTRVLFRLSSDRSAPPPPIPEVAAGILEASGGEIWSAFSADDGPSVYFTLPAAAGPTAHLEQNFGFSAWIT